MPVAKSAVQNWKMKAPVFMSDWSGQEYFYDGQLEIVRGRVEVPRERIEWAKRLRMNGYEFTTRAQEDEFLAISTAVPA